MEAQPRLMEGAFRTMDEPRAGIYRHFKGNLYRLTSIAKHSETLEPLVVYQALYGERGLWVRPLPMWSERVVRDGYDGPRFQYVCEREEDIPR